MTHTEICDQILEQLSLTEPGDRITLVVVKHQVSPSGNVPVSIYGNLDARQLLSVAEGAFQDEAGFERVTKQ